jgi:hypothetical protein
VVRRWKRSLCASAGETHDSGQSLFQSTPGINTGRISADAQGQRHEICGFFDWTYPQAVYYLDDRPQPPRVDRHQDPLRLR